MCRHRDPPRARFLNFKKLGSGFATGASSGFDYLAVCERLFARSVMGFGDDQEKALEDYKSASTIMRYNNCLMKSSGLVPY